LRMISVISGDRSQKERHCEIACQLSREGVQPRAPDRTESIPERGELLRHWPLLRAQAELPEYAEDHSGWWNYPRRQNSPLRLAVVRLSSSDSAGQAAIQTQPQARREPELRSLTNWLVTPTPPPISSQLLGDGEAQPCAAILPRSGGIPG